MHRLPLAPLTAALLMALSAQAAADEQAKDHEHLPARTLDTIEVTASPLRSGVDDLARPVEVLAGEDLDARKSGTLGQTLERQAGVQSSYFGAGVGRPIIRGQDGARVQVLNGGTSALDVSTVSADHAVTIEPFLADQIEVLKGPATLLYGSGAIGGAVNVVDGRVPTVAIGRALSGRGELRHGSGAGEDTGMLRLDGDAGRLTWHVDGFRRVADDVGIPGFAFAPSLVDEALADGEDPDHLARGTLPNSALTTSGGALGASWLGERGWFGAALGTYRSNYGIPPGAHAHDGGDEEETVRIDLHQDRLDLRGGLRALGPLQELNFRLSRNDYRHVELEGDEVGTRFRNRGTEARIEALPRDLLGWRGAFGLQYGLRDFAAAGDEAFVPPSETRDLGLFLLQERSFGPVKLELGARVDRVRVDPAGARPTITRDARSLAAGALWKFSEPLHLSLNLDHAERLPTAEELFSDGPHIATGSYELGDATLGKESATSAELGLHLHQGRIGGKLSLYRTHFDDFIYLGDTGLENAGLPVRTWVQGDADFTGWEAEATIELSDGPSGLWDLRLFADAVDARLDAGGRLPRIAPGRVGADLNWSRDGWRARLGAIRVATQDEVAPMESPTGGYSLLDAGVARHWDRGAAGWEVFLEARNLTDVEARAHTSFLKDLAPLAGRNVNLGLRVSF